MNTTKLAESVSPGRTTSGTAVCEPPRRRLTFNGRSLTNEQQRCLESLERSLGLRLPDRDYWCDPLELWA